MKDKTQKTIRLWAVNLCRMLLAAAFLFSGTVKLNDPLGTQYKIEDYGHAFGMASLIPAPIPLVMAVALAMLEFCLGVFMFFGIHRWTISRTMTLLLLIFTPLTLYLALTNPVSDCGCFGDAWILTNWQTFWKNIVLLSAAIAVAWHYKSVVRFITRRNQWLITLYTWVFALVFALVNIHGLPLIDFRPYHIGADILQKMGMNEEESAQYETYFIMEKDGVRQEFTLEDYPDSTWTFIDSRTEVVGGSQSLPEIHDLEIVPVDGPGKGEDITTDLLSDPGYKFLLIAPYLETADDGVMDRITTIYDYCLEHNYQFLCLTSSGEESIARWKDITAAEYPFCHVDAVTLKTMIRSNPGLMLLQGSSVVNKWPSTRLPQKEELVQPLEDLPLAHPQVSSFVHRVLHILLWYLVPILLWTLGDRLWVTWKMRNLHKYKVTNHLKEQEK